MIQDGGPGVVSCDSTPAIPATPPPRKKFVFGLKTTSLLFLLLSFIYYFRKYNGKHRNCLYTAGRLLPPPGAVTMVEVNLKRTFSSRGEGTAIKDNVIIVEKVGCNKNGQKGREKHSNLLYLY